MRKHVTTKMRYRMNEIIIIIIGGMIPVVNVLDFADLQIRIVSSILGATVVIITGLTQ